MILSNFRNSFFLRLSCIVIVMAIVVFALFIGSHYILKGSTVVYNEKTKNSEQIKTNVLPEIPWPGIRFVPEFPEAARKSGHCLVNISFNEDSKVENVKIESCTDPVFEQPTLDAVYKWVYPRRFRNGKLVPFKFKEHKVTYRLYDENGIIITE